MRRVLIALALVATCLVAHAEAWWCVGHMVIAEIARQNLKPGVEATIDKHFQFLNQWFPQSNNMVSGACWADDLKSHRLEVMAGWHFINQVYNPQNITFKSPIQEINVETAITKLDKTLDPRNTDDTEWVRSYAVANMVHFIGDIHQPLHATDRFTPEFPNGDFGGNKIHVNWGGKEWALHFIWDSVCAQYDNTPPRPLSATDYAWIKSLAYQYQANFTVPEAMKSVYNSTVFAQESYDFAVQYAYDHNLIQPGQTLTQDYINKCKVAAGYRLAYAGYRLAHELNYIGGAHTTAPPSTKDILRRVAEVREQAEAAKVAGHM